MSANVETMFSVREKVWHGLGIIVQDAPSSKDALRMAGLDWRVESSKMFIEDTRGSMMEVPNVIANTRSTDKAVLGVVTGKYKIVQNEEAFSFTDALLGEDIHYETAGALDEGRKVWMLARMPESEILGDKFENYLLFTNSHDGKGSVKVVPTKIRVVCQNTLNIAIRGAVRSWTTKHMGAMETKLLEAHRTLELATKYDENFVRKAEELSGVKVSMLEFNSFVEHLLPMPEEATKRQQDNVVAMRDDLTLRYKEAPDLGNHRGTAWGVLNAVSDFATHKTPLRMTDTYRENNFASIIDGNKMIDMAAALLTA